MKNAVIFFCHYELILTYVVIINNTDIFIVMNYNRRFKRGSHRYDIYSVLRYQP